VSEKAVAESGGHYLARTSKIFSAAWPSPKGFGALLEGAIFWPESQAEATGSSD